MACLVERCAEHFALAHFASPRSCPIAFQLAERGATPLPSLFVTERIHRVVHCPRPAGRSGPDLRSVVALALILERLWSLRRASLRRRTCGSRSRISSNGATRSPSRERPSTDRSTDTAAGLANVKSPRPVIRETIEVGRVVTHDLERFLTTLGTIAAMAPLLGLFGTVVGMIEIFGSQTAAGSNPIQLAHGISVALYNTAFGLIVAIPSMIFYRHFRATVDSLIVEMEQQAIRLVDFAHGERK
jgi:biopolymer transport protein ExbB